VAKRDRQRARVYAWEARVVAPRDPSAIAFHAAQGMVDAIWSEMDLRYPPKVEALPAQARTRIADADRLTLRLRPQTPSWCLLHEIAHAMSTTQEGDSDGHGPSFMGIYVRLLVRYLRLGEAELLQSLTEAGIRVSNGARPPFIDPSG
jgi:hypothetical protein